MLNICLMQSGIRDWNLKGKSFIICTLEKYISLQILGKSEITPTFIINN